MVNGFTPLKSPALKFATFLDIYFRTQVFLALSDWLKNGHEKRGGGGGGSSITTLKYSHHPDWPWYKSHARTLPDHWAASKCTWY